MSDQMSEQDWIDDYVKALAKKLEDDVGPFHAEDLLLSFGLPELLKAGKIMREWQPVGLRSGKNWDAAIAEGLRKVKEK